MRIASRTRFRPGVLGTTALLGAGLLLAPGCGPGDEQPVWPDKPGPKVLVSFPPLYSFVTSVAGDRANVVSLLTTHGPHGYETTKRDARFVAGADIFFVNGLGLDEPIARKLKKAANPDLKLIELGETLDKNTLFASEHAHDHDHDHAHDHGHAHHDHDHDHGPIDPHVWLGIAEAKEMVRGIAGALAEHDPAHGDEYKANADAYAAKLDELHAEGKAMLEGKTERKIVTFHESLRYFAHSFGLEIAGVIQVSAGSEPSPKKMKEIIETCKKQNVRLIAVEPQYPSNTAAARVLEALKAEGIDAAFVEIDPLETAEPSALSPGLYEKVMRQNLKNLADALR